jgi:hypothetical protein
VNEPSSWRFSILVHLFVEDSGVGRNNCSCRRRRASSGPPGPPSCGPPQRARAAGLPAESLSPLAGSCRGRRDAHVHRPIAPGRSSLPVPRKSFHRLHLPSEISPHIHSAGSVAVLVNAETTPVQLHATLFPSGDPAGQGISSYLPVCQILVSLRYLPVFGTPVLPQMCWRGGRFDPP